MEIRGKLKDIFFNIGTDPAITRSQEIIIKDQYIISD